MKSTQATHYQDTIALMDFGFLRFKNVNISENETAYTSGDQPVQIGDNSYQPSDLSMDTLAVITLPKDASFADAEKTVVTDLPEDAPQGAVALLSYKYNDRKIGQAHRRQKRKQTGRRLRMTEIRHRIRQHPIQVRPENRSRRNLRST